MKFSEVKYNVIMKHPLPQTHTHILCLSNSTFILTKNLSTFVGSGRVGGVLFNCITKKIQAVDLNINKMVEILSSVSF